MPRAKTVMVDMDGVICSEEIFNERCLAKPLDGAREGLQKLRAAGYVVVIYTARGWGEYRMTKDWLDKNGFEYDGLHMGKPVADYWIDDRAIGFEDWDQALGEIKL